MRVRRSDLRGSKRDTSRSLYTQCSERVGSKLPCRRNRRSRLPFREAELVLSEEQVAGPLWIRLLPSHGRAWKEGVDPGEGPPDYGDHHEQG
jgi:hypothetical protein